MALANSSSVQHGHRRQFAPLEETFAAGELFLTPGLSYAGFSRKECGKESRLLPSLK
jgi:hypothetical protein